MIKKYNTVMKVRMTEEDLMELEPPSSPDCCDEPSIPDKSRSLRARSVQKRFQTELKQKGRRKKEKISKAARMTKYRRKAANAKERERMKKVNEAYERLRGVMPDLSLILQDEKDTKVTTLRAAITYIYGLQNLLDDIHAGSFDPIKYKEQEPKLPMKKTPKQTKSRPPRQNRSKSLKVSPVTLAVKAATVGAGQQINKKSGHLVTTSLPLQPRDGLVLQPVSVTSQMNSENGTKIVGNGGNLNQLITLHNDNSTLTAQVLQTFRVTTPSSLNSYVPGVPPCSTPNLLFLEPIPASELNTTNTPLTTPLPSMETLRRKSSGSFCPTSQNISCNSINNLVSKEYYVLLNSNPILSSTATTTTNAVGRSQGRMMVSSLSDKQGQFDWLPSNTTNSNITRPRRDSGSSCSTGFNIQSPSSSPNNSLSSGCHDLDYDSSPVLDTSMECVISMVNVNMDSTATLPAYEVMKCSTNDKNLAEDIPESPTTLEPSIGQLFRRQQAQQTYQQVESMDQYVILDDIHQIIEENSSLLL